MFTDTPAFSGFSVDNLEAAREFYASKLGLQVDDSPMGLMVQLSGGAKVFVYLKPNHQPASYTVLNFQVSDIDKAVGNLTAAGITPERYPDMSHQDAAGIARGLQANMGPDIAWFKDPAGNILSVLQDS
jgi:catechol 2,3-dioxygenase-like lactoylglutathione lyase family enzyme